MDSSLTVGWEECVWLHMHGLAGVKRGGGGLGRYICALGNGHSSTRAIWAFGLGESYVYTLGRVYPARRCRSFRRKYI